MKHIRFLQLAALLLATCALSAETIPVVLSPSSVRESAGTARIAPTSAIAPDVAFQAANQLTALVPGSRAFSVMATGSMRPAFDDNSMLLVEPSPYENLQIGDIVVYRHEGSQALIVHRIVEKRKAGFWTMGDHNKTMDREYVTPANYVGRVYGIIYASRSGAPMPTDGTRKQAALLAVSR